MSTDDSTILCSECHGETVSFKGRGLDMQYKICSRWKEPGHKSEDEVKQEISSLRRQIRPSGRFA